METFILLFDFFSILFLRSFFFTQYWSGSSMSFLGLERRAPVVEVGAVKTRNVLGNISQRSIPRRESVAAMQPRVPLWSTSADWNLLPLGYPIRSPWAPRLRYCAPSTHHFAQPTHTHTHTRPDTHTKKKRWEKNFCRKPLNLLLVALPRCLLPAR